MILAEKIIQLRKKNGISQQELADKLDVSRQAVSKWESGTSICDLTRIVKMAQLFQVSTDYLLNDDIEQLEEEYNDSSQFDSRLYKVDMSQANNFLSMKEKSANTIAIGVFLCIVSPALLIVLACLLDSELVNISEKGAVSIGLICLFLFVGVAVYLFIIESTSQKDSVDLSKIDFETEYGVDSIIKERRRMYLPIYSRNIAISVVACIFSAAVLAIVSIISQKSIVTGTTVALMLIVIGLAVRWIINSCIIKESFDTLLQIEDYSKERKKVNKKVEKFAALYWMIVVTGFLAYSLITNNWKVSWIIWPIAAVAFSIVEAVISIIYQKD